MKNSNVIPADEYDVLFHLCLRDGTRDDNGGFQRGDYYACNVSREGIEFFAQLYVKGQLLLSDATHDCPPGC